MHRLRLFYTLLKGSLWRKFISDTRHVFAFILGISSILLFTLSILLLIPFYDNESIISTIGTDNFVSYILVGASFLPIYGLAMWESADQFQQEISNKLIDYTFSSPIYLYDYIMALICSSAIMNSINFLIVFLAAIIFSAPSATITGVLMALVSVVVSFVLLAQIGATFSLLVLLYKGVSHIARIMNVLFQFLTGMIVPVLLLPFGVKEIATIFPLTASIDLARYYLIGSHPIAPIYALWTITIIEIVIFAGVAFYLTGLVEEQARTRGLT